MVFRLFAICILLAAAGCESTPSSRPIAGLGELASSESFEISFHRKDEIESEAFDAVSFLAPLAIDLGKRLIKSIIQAEADKYVSKSSESQLIKLDIRLSEPNYLSSRVLDESRYFIVARSFAFEDPADIPPSAVVITKELRELLAADIAASMMAHHTGKEDDAPAALTTNIRKRLDSMASGDDGLQGLKDGDVLSFLALGMIGPTRVAQDTTTPDKGETFDFSLLGYCYPGYKAKHLSRGWATVGLKPSKALLTLSMTGPGQDPHLGGNAFEAGATFPVSYSKDWKSTHAKKGFRSAHFAVPSYGVLNVAVTLHESADIKDFIERLSKEIDDYDATAAINALTGDD